jgi:hypothetical protein
MEKYWKIDNLERRTNDGTVLIVHWSRCVRIDDEELSVMGGTTLDEPTESFIPFGDLTSNTVISWLESNPEINVDLIDSELDLLIKEHLTPPITQGLPWE